MIVVEGPDGAGKTTLITQLSERYNLPVAPRVVTKDAEAMVNLKTWVEDNAKQGFQPVIFDRHRLISETIYGPVLRSRQSEGFTDFTWLSVQMRRFYDSKPLIIYCLPSLETVMKNIEGDLSNRVVWDSIESIYTAYASRAAIDSLNHPHTVHVWDYTRDFLLEGPDPLRYFDQHIPQFLNRKA